MIRAAHAKAEAYRAVDGAESEPPPAPAAPVECTPLPSVAPLVGEARRTYEAGVTRPYRFREEQLRGIERLVDENADRLAAALWEDLGQGPMYAECFEMTHVGNHARHSRAHLREWMETKRAPTPFPLNLSVPIRSEVAPEPRGVALIMTPWNMPVQLVLNPLIDALAAGCVCVLKMSERSVASTRLFTELLTCGKYVDPRAVRLVNGGVEEATALLEQRFDAIMYTGGGKVGRIVARAAARNLTPVVSATEIGPDSIQRGDSWSPIFRPRVSCGHHCDRSERAGIGYIENGDGHCFLKPGVHAVMYFFY